jgi:signal transduction histidine kinase
LFLILCLQVISAGLSSYQIRSIFMKEFSQNAENISKIIFLELDEMIKTYTENKEIGGSKLAAVIDDFMQVIQFKLFNTVLKSEGDLLSLLFVNKLDKVIVSSKKTQDGYTNTNSENTDLNKVYSEILAINEKRMLNSFRAHGNVHVFVPYFFQNSFAGGVILSFTDKKLVRANNRLLLMAVVIVIFYMAFASIIVTLITKRILTQPINEMTRLMSKLADGELNQWYQITSLDEIGRLGKSVNELISSLQRTFSNIRTTIACKEGDEPDHQKGDAQNKVLERLEKAEFELRLLFRKFVDFIEDERKKIANDLHDDIGQSITALQLNIKSLELSIHESEVEQKAQCAKAVDQIKDLSKNVRITYSRLRPELLDDLGLAAAIENQINKFNSFFKKTTLEFSTTLSGQRFDPHAEIALFRVFQESLNNVIKHACAQNVIVTLNIEGNLLKMSIKDDGIGFDQKENELLQISNETGIGLLSIKERIAALNGEVSIRSGINKGTQITTVLNIVGRNDIEENQSIDS